jgi:hypothetical protein
MRLSNHFYVSITTKEISGGVISLLGPSFQKMMLEEVDLNWHHCLLKFVEVRTAALRY